MTGALELASPLPLLRWPFLTAEWRNLCLFTYALEPARLERYLPPGCTLDTKDGRAFVSLVAFDFARTRVLGVSWPGYRAFPEINLRFYVRHGDLRGVCFIRELVPKRLIAWVARSLYNEPYYALPMHSSVRESENALEVEHVVRVRGRSQRLRVLARRTERTSPEGSTEHFFKEHRWGFGRSRTGQLVRYEVRHPVWATYPVERFDLDWEFGAVYGPEWSDLARMSPVSVVLAKGSAVSVSPRG